MKVFKFGGASVKSAEAIENVALLLKNYAPTKVVVIVSAMGKITNALEKVLHAWYNNEDYTERLSEVKNFHHTILQQLFSDASHPVYSKVNHYFQELEKRVNVTPSGNFDFDYDQIVSFGELLSSTIIADYLCEKNFNCHWCDVRNLIITDENWREGNVNWKRTEQAINKQTQTVFSNNEQPQIILTQGFLGGTENNRTITLGREGSDYTAAIFSYALNADEMVVWKDVDGILNADPKIFSDTILLPHISYGEAIELTYYGATVIHPKTIKPLQNKKIPLYVRSFLNPESVGTLITETAEVEKNIPSYIVKTDQLLVSIAPKNFSFIAEQSLSEIFTAFAHAGIRMNMTQNSAISFTACISNNQQRIKILFEKLSDNFSIKYNSDLQLITIRHWTPEAIEKMICGKNVLLEQRNRTTAQMVLK